MDSNSPHLPGPEEPSRVLNATAAPAVDDLDDLFNYDVGVEDVFRDVDTNMDVITSTEPRRGNDKSNTGVGLGIDEEIKVSRKRRPIAKLDEARYISSHLVR